MSKTVDDVRAVIDGTRIALITVKVASSTKVVGFRSKLFLYFLNEFCFVITICDLVHDVEAIHDLC